MNKLVALVRGFIDFLLVLYRRRGLIFEMAKRDILSHHVGSMLGFFWTFINPLIMISILWFVFSLGFKTMPKGDVPFVVWLTAGMCVWNTFVEAVNGSTASIISNPYLVKKIVFPLSILSVVKLVVSFITHSIFLVLLIILIVMHKMSFSLYWLQVFYYFGAMSVLALGLGWITSAVNVFARDTSSIVGVILQMGFWGTPIFWDIFIIPEKYRFIVKLNPMFYIVQGYRDSFIYKIPFWNYPEMTIYYWIVTGSIFLVGAFIFLKLRPHFADVL